MQPKHFKTSMWSWQLCFTSNKHHLICLLHARKKIEKADIVWYCLVLYYYLIALGWQRNHALPGQQFHILRVVKAVGIAHVNDVLPIGQALQQLLQEIQLLKNAPLHLEKWRPQKGILLNHRKKPEFTLWMFIRWNQKVHEAGRPAWLWLDAFDH